ncbi:MAG TPA: 4-alpha-glucanotransferase, partial [Pyrinomonadaceae bacterium]|nr:4-alpha-glucanotransferase [Pyrinomonadaceae bacterium]
MKFPRASGILLHPTSLPGQFGIGDFGAEAFEFVDFLAGAKQTHWQILPLNPTGYGDSPYQCFSVFAGNTLLISPGELLEDGLLSKQDLEEKPDFTGDKVDYGRVFDWKEKILAAAFQNFSEKPEPNFQREFEVFQQHNWFWLDDYALYRALRKNRNQKSWLEWEESLRFRDETALQNARQEFSEEIMAQKFYQFLFFRQWFALKNYAGEKGIKFIGDVPIFVSFDSADVWCNQTKFKLNEDGSPRVVAGVPPDYF